MRIESKANNSVSKKANRTYFPVVAVFAISGLLTLATSHGVMGFMGYSLILLSLLKLVDLAAFHKSFEKYDLLTGILPIYGKVYPFLELVLGLGFLSRVAPLVTGSVSALVGVAGGISIFKAVYVDKKDLNCGCVGGNSNVPLGLVSFIENGVMAVMGFYILFGTSMA